MSQNEELSIIELLEVMSKNPHDAAFKLFMKHQDVSVPFIRSKMPTSLEKRCHWEDIQLQPTEFLDKHFSEQRADLLFEVPYGKLNSCNIYILFESQRKPDKTMPFRLLKYMVEIWSEIERKRLLQYQAEKEQKLAVEARIDIYPLPSIFPIVLYNGQTRWTTPASFRTSQLVDIPQGMTSFVPDFEHIVTDLRRMKEEDFAQYKDFIHTYHVLKITAHSQAGEVLPTLESMLEYLQQIFINEPYLARIFFTLALHIENKSISTQHQIADFLENQVNKGENMTTILHDILEKGRKEGKQEGIKEGILQGRKEGIKEGKQEGIKEGKQEGIKEGKHKANLQNAKNLLALGISVEIIQKVTGLSIEEIENLQK